MRFYTQTPRHYCGVDLHARTMYVCVQNHEGDVVLRRDRGDAHVYSLSARCAGERRSYFCLTRGGLMSVTRLFCRAGSCRSASRGRR
jgi:hypothetical protein